MVTTLSRLLHTLARPQPRLSLPTAMDYWSPGVLQAHTGSGGMTSSLSVGKAGSAAVRKLKQFPLSPILVTGRSGIKAAVPLEDPRFHSVTTPAGELATELGQLVRQQWPSRTRAVNSREDVEAALQQME